MSYTKILDRSNVLVAGGAGFIGSHLCDALLEKNNVICIDNFITGQEENIDLLMQNQNFKFIKHDLIEPIDLEALPELEVFKVKYQGLQQIYNLACPTSPKEYHHLPIETLLTNSQGTRNLLDLAVKYKARFLHASSASIYGEPVQNQKFKESDWGSIDPVGPRSCYNEGKRFAESLVVNYGNYRSVDFRIARIFNTFGPRMKLQDGRMIPDFIAHALTNQPLTIYGSPEEISTYCYVSDMVDGLLKLMDHTSSGVFNLGSPEPYKMKDIAQMIIDLTSARVVFEEAAALPYLARQGVPDITLAKEQLGWFPLTKLEDGLRSTINYGNAHEYVLGPKLSA